MDLKNFLNFTYLLHLDWSFDLSNGVSHWQNSPYLEEKNVWWVPFLVLPKRLMCRIVGVTCSGKSLNNKTRIGNKQRSILRDYIQRKQLFVTDLSYFCRSCPLITIIIPWWLFKPHPSLNPSPPPPPITKKTTTTLGKKTLDYLKKVTWRRLRRLSTHLPLLQSHCPQANVPFPSVHLVLFSSCSGYKGLRAPCSVLAIVLAGFAFRITIKISQ